MSYSSENPVLRRLLEATDPGDIKAAAIELLKIHDATNFEVSRYLQEGERIYKAYMADGKMKR